MRVVQSKTRSAILIWLLFILDLLATLKRAVTSVRFDRAGGTFNKKRTLKPTLTLKSTLKHSISPPEMISGICNTTCNSGALEE